MSSSRFHSLSRTFERGFGRGPGKLRARWKSGSIAVGSTSSSALLCSTVFYFPHLFSFSSLFCNFYPFLLSLPSLLSSILSSLCSKSLSKPTHACAHFLKTLWLQEGVEMCRMSSRLVVPACNFHQAFLKVCIPWMNVFPDLATQMFSGFQWSGWMTQCKAVLFASPSAHVAV